MDPKYCENVDLCDEKHRSEGNTKHEIVSIGDVCPSLHLTKCETHDQKYCLLDCKDLSKHQDEDVENIVEDLSKHQDKDVKNIVEDLSKHQDEDVENIVEDLSKHQDNYVSRLSIVEDLSKHQDEDVESIVHLLSQDQVEVVENIAEDLSKHQDEDVENIVEDLSKHQDEDVENIVEDLSKHQDNYVSRLSIVEDLSKHQDEDVESIVHLLSQDQVEVVENIAEDLSKHQDEDVENIVEDLSKHQDEDVENIVEDLSKHQDNYVSRLSIVEDLSKHQDEDVESIVHLLSQDQVEVVENIAEDLSKHQDEDVENIVEDLSKHQDKDVENIVEDLSKHQDNYVSRLSIVEDLSKHQDEDVESSVHLLSQDQVEDIEDFSKNLNSKNVGNICHLCHSTLKVQSHCKICRLNICKNCEESHVSNGGKVHELVSIDEVCPSSNLTKCKTHNQMICTFECKECHKFMCSLCIRSGHHRGHQVEEVAHIVKVSSTYIVKTGPPSETTDDLNEMITWSKHITSKKLRDVFNSFQVGFPDDPLNESIVHKILNEDFLRGLKVEINSLATGIMLIKNINREHLVKPGEVCVFELDVINEGDQLVVIQKDNCSQKLFYSNEENIARIILIRSDSIPVIEAKLAVYRNYKHLIIQRNIWLQHEYEEFDEVAKLIAYERLSSICVSIELLINVFTIGLSRINSEPIGKQSTTEDIKTVCNKTFNIAKDEAVGLVNCNFYQKGEWGDMIAQFIHEKFYVNGEPEIADVLNEIKKMCQKTVDDLNNILRGLEDFLLKVQPEDQSKVIEEWFKREVIQAGPALQKYPSIIQFIAGHTKDGQIVVKVYLRNDDKEAESYFKNGSKMLKDTKFEFVCVNKNSKAILKEVEKITHHEKRAPAIDRSTLAKLGNVIQEEGIKIYAQYSNVIGIGISQVRCVGDMIINEPCIVLYCLDKNIIPFGEKPLPESIAGWPCDIREDFVMFGKCPRPCPSPSLNFPESGCSIGIPSVDSAGSVGFLVESKNPIYKMQCGFLTASHVAIDCFEVLYHHKSLLSMNHLLSTREHCIVHPSWHDSGNIDFRIGNVVESFIGNYGSEKRGLDFALVKNYISRKEEKDPLTVANDLQLTFDGKMSVIKTGRTTGTTVGVLQHNILSVKVHQSFLSREFFVFFNCYAIGNTSNEVFFREGDSGSGVFVKESDGTIKPLGIAFAYMNSQTAVCRIDEIVKSLDLTIVKYRTSP